MNDEGPPSERANGPRTGAGAATPADDRRAQPGLAAMLDLSGRRALVTGAASGIGRAIALRLAEAGAALDLVDRDADGLQCVAEDTGRWGPDTAVHVVDLADRAAIEALWATLADRPPDTIVNNAGAYPERSFVEIDEAFYRQVMAVNLDAAVWMCRELIARRARRGGVIVNVGSVEALLPFKADLEAYSVAKAGVLALTRALARDHAARGFRVNAVVPGGIGTPGTRRLARRALTGRPGLIKTGWDFRQRLPAGRMGTPDEVARVVLFLASDLAAYVHGAIVPVDGGFLSA